MRLLSPLMIVVVPCWCPVAGSSAAHFRFIETPGLQADSSSSGAALSKVTPPWLQIDPMEGVVEEGCEIDICLTGAVCGSCLCAPLIALCS